MLESCSFLLLVFSVLTTCSCLCEMAISSSLSCYYLLRVAYDLDIVHIHTYIHTHIHTCIHTYMHTYIHTYIHQYIHACMHTYTYIHTHTYVRTYTHIHTYMHTCIHAYIYAYMKLFYSSDMGSNGNKRSTRKAVDLSN